MDYIYIENLVLSAKNGDKYSKELLALEFHPFIINISKVMKRLSFALI